MYSADLKSQKMDTRNGVTRQRLSETALPSSEQAARPDALTGGMPQEANAQGNAWDRLTWGRHTRGHRGTKGLNSKAPLPLEANANPECADAKLRG